MAKAILKLKRPITEFEVDIEENSLEVIGYTPTVEPKHGYWIEVPDEVFASTYYCSECKGEAIPDIYGKYLLSDWCYYCGAKMENANDT